MQLVGDLVGRDAVLADLDARLRSRRLVTVVGPGGVGKTSVSLVAAERAAAHFPRGVHVVDLARISAPSAVAGEIAAQLGFTSYAALVATPEAHAPLVVVDNCEHVLDAAAEAITGLLEACTAATVLATSRSPLAVSGESVLTLAPLKVPSPDDADAAASPPVRLFLSRAHDAGAPADEADIASVVRLCERLDGLPLAIEIAAARTRTMTIADLLQRLDGGVAVLERPRHRGSGRHRSVTELVRWSIDLLDPADAELLERLAVLPGRFTVHDVEVLLVDDGEGIDVQRVLDTLVDASLVAVDRGAAAAGYRLLDTVRSCAMARLQVRGAHAHRAEEFARRVDERVWARIADAGARWDGALLRDVASHFDAIATALRWSVDNDPDPRRSVSLCAALFALVQQGRAFDIRELASAVAERWPDAVGRGVPLAAEAWSTLATAENLTNNPERAIALAERTLVGLDPSAWAHVTLRRAIGQSWMSLGEREAAARAFAEGAAHGRRLGLTAMALELEMGGAQLLADDGAIEEALAAMRAARDESDALGSALNSSWAATLIAWTTLRVDVDEGIRLARLALEEGRALDYPNACAVNLRSIAVGQVVTGQYEAAAATIASLLAETRDRGSLANARLLVDVAAALARHVEHGSAGSLSATVATLPPATMTCTPWFQFDRHPAPPGEPLSMREALREVETLVAEVRSGAVTPPAPRAEAAASSPSRSPSPSSMRERGDAWEITFEGRSVTVRALKGMGDIAAILAAGGREVHCLDLIGAGASEPSTGAVIDQQARRAYEQRIRELQEDIDDAEAANDHRRAERAQIEFDTLVDHLAAAVGRGGRSRRAADTVERARTAVAQRVRAALRHLDNVDAVLGRHLRRSLRMGIYCSYAPERSTAWTVERLPP